MSPVTFVSLILFLTLIAFLFTNLGKNKFVSAKASTIAAYFVLFSLSLYFGFGLTFWKDLGLLIFLTLTVGTISYFLGLAERQAPIQ